MRIVGGMLVLLLCVCSAGAQNAPAAGKMRNPAAGASGPRSPAAETTAAQRAPAVNRPPTPKGEAIPPAADVMAIQMDLAWTGDYNAVVNGERNEKTTAAVKAFQRSRKFKETGVLNPQERALLAATVKTRQAQVGWRMIDDPVTGARLGLPTKQVSVKVEGKTGTRWTSAQGQVQVETFRIREPGTTLAQVYEQQRKEPSTRKTVASLLKSDLFVLSGMQGLKRFYVRGEIRDGEVRGLTVLFDQATEPVMEPVAVAMVGAFAGFPGITGVAQIGPQPRRKVEYATGIVVSDAGHILTDRTATDDCNVIVVSGYGDATRHAEGDELALLRVYGAAGLTPAAFAPEPPRGPDVTVVGIADPQRQDGGSAISTATAKLKGEQVEPTPPVGFAGSAVLDGQGRLIGMLALKSAAGAAMVAGAGAAVPPPQATVVGATTIQPFLARQQLAPATGRAGLEAARTSLVRVICVRK